jgi:hypothetical protein
LEFDNMRCPDAVFLVVFNRKEGVAIVGCAFGMTASGKATVARSRFVDRTAGNKHNEPVVFFVFSMKVFMTLGGEHSCQDASSHSSWSAY